MSFYSSIAPYYDLLFPFDETTYRFVLSEVERTSGRSWLDAGCGIGTLLSALSDRFHSVVGLDTDPELLKLAAKKMLPGERKKVELLEESIADLDTVFPEDEFSLITCLGNTLPHLTEPAVLAAFFDSVKTHLESRGRFVFQTINYDRILAEGLRGLPTIERGEVTFERYYSLPNEKGLIEFSTVLTDPENSREIRNTVSLRPLSKKAMDDALAHAGLRSCAFYADFTGSPWREDSYLTVGVVSI